MQNVSKALNSKTRIDILKLLMEGENHIGRLAEKLGKDISTMSRHIDCLQRANFIVTRKEGKLLICRIKNKAALNNLFNAINRLEEIV